MMAWARPPHHHHLGPASSPTAGMSHDSEAGVTKDTNIDANMVVILGVLLFALLCALGLNSVVRCLLRCTTQHHHHHQHSHNRREVGLRGGAALMGGASRGLKRSSIRQLPTTIYHVGTSGEKCTMDNKVMSTDCMICLGEFTEGEKIKVLPKCKHGFHGKCIDAWLLSHSTCPTCRQSLLEWARSNGAIVVSMAFENRSDFARNGASSGGTN